MLVGIVASFQRVAESTAARPVDLASGISTALIATFAAVPLGIAGIVLLIAGLVFRRPVE
jgi:biopolymer transport protein ExbB/TolQ